MKISVIIPAYNAAGFIGGCLSSVGSRVEMVVVDDGSTDGTGTVVAQGFPSVRLLRQENAGVSAARNAGIRQASGEYLVFADADDNLCEGAIERLEAFLTSSAPDILVMRSFGSRAERYPWCERFPEGTSLTKDDIAREGYVRGSVCGCAFRKDYLKDCGVWFDERLSIAEDTVFFANALSAGGSVVFADIPFYRVFERPDSAYRTRDEGFLRRYAPALGSALDIADPLVRTRTCFSIIQGLTETGIRMGLSVRETEKQTALRDALPLMVEGTGRDGWLIRLLNVSYPLFYALKRAIIRLRS